MMLKAGSPAIHKLGDIGREVDDLIRIHSENNEYYIGNFEEGFGFIDVKFKKEDCRPLTKEEREDLNGKWYTISGTPLYRIYVDEEGNVIKEKVLSVTGVIDNVTDNQGNMKHNNFIGMVVTFGEDIEIGRSMIMMTDQGTLTTSKVVEVNKYNNNYEIITKNSIYYIGLCH